MIQHLFILLKCVDFFHAYGDTWGKVGYCGGFRDIATVWLRVEFYYYSLCMSLWQSRIYRVHRSGIYTLSCLRGTYRGSGIYYERVVCNIRRIFHSRIYRIEVYLIPTRAYRDEWFLAGGSAAEARRTAMSMRESSDILWVYRSRVPRYECVTKITVFSSSIISCSIRKADANRSMSLLKFGSIRSFLTLYEGDIISCVVPVALWIECECSRVSRCIEIDGMREIGGFAWYVVSCSERTLKGNVWHVVIWGVAILVLYYLDKRSEVHWNVHISFGRCGIFSLLWTVCED